MTRPTSKKDLLNAAKAKVQKVEGTSTYPYITSVVDKVSGDNTAIKVGSVMEITGARLKFDPTDGEAVAPKC